MAYTLQAAIRDGAGKGAARAARRAGQTPAVIYGDNQAPVTITLESKELRRHLAATFFTHVYTLDVAGTSHQVLPRDVQFCPLTEQPMHVDFLRVSAKTKISVKVPLEFINSEKAPGIKEGGLLNIVQHDVELRVSHNNIPEHITIDLSGRVIGDSIHLEDIKLPEGAEIIGGQNVTLATIAVPKATIDSDADAENAADAVAPAADAK